MLHGKAGLHAGPLHRLPVHRPPHPPNLRVWKHHLRHGHPGHRAARDQQQETTRHFAGGGTIPQEE